MMKSSANKILSQIFRNMSDIYQYLGSKERFRVLAYSKASRIIGSLPEDISRYLKNDTLEEIPGIGESIAEKIREFIRTGKISKYEKLKKSVPFELMDLLEVRGFGPRSLSRIHEELKITSKEKLIAALQNGSIAKLKGFGPKKAEQMLRGLKIHKTIEERMFLWDALESGERVLDYLRNLPETVQAELAGSLRRRKETIGDIDVLVTCEEKNRKKIVSHFINAHFARQVLAKGETKASILLKESGRQVDLRIVKPDEWGAALQYFTGSKEHNIHLRTIARDKGYKISEYGVFRLKNEEKVAGLTEAEIYKTLGLQIIPPEMREDRGEIELAAKNKIPRLVSPEDIKGDLQMHSTWSDGVCSLEELVSFVKKNFSYDYMVITDHSKSSRIAKGMDEKQLAKQIKAIDRLNAKTGGSFLKKGIEVDILPNGRLDIGNDLLQQLDWVTASIHSGFNKDATDRLLAACEHPFVNCIGHPTGRLIGSREPYDFDFDQLVKAAKRTHTALEINAQPDRMDLNDEMAFRARKEGIPLVISTDSHAPGNFHFMKLGVYIARRAWCTSKDILNTGSWKSIEQFRKQKNRN